MAAKGDRHEAKQGETPTKRARRTSAHNKTRKQTWFAPVCPSCARQKGVSRERKADRNSPRQSAWAECVCGRVCGRLSAFLGWFVWGFGCFLGVFGVFSCFFDILWL